MEKIVILSGGNSPLAKEIATELVKINPTLLVRFIPNATVRFADGETAARLPETIRGWKTYIFQDYAASAEMLVQASQLLETAYKCDAISPTLIIPYLPYSRQDKPTGREMGFVAKVLAIFALCKAERLMSLDLHSKQIRSMTEIKFEDFSARKIFQEYLLAQDLVDEETVIVAPDEGAAKNCKIFAENLKKTLYYLPKSRLSDKSDQLSRLVANDLNVLGKTVIIPDDILSTGGTLVSAMQYLRQQGARKIIVLISHCQLTGPALENLKKTPPDLLVTTNSTARAHLLDSVCPYKELSIAPLFAQAIERIETNGGLSDLLADYN